MVSSADRVWFLTWALHSNDGHSAKFYSIGPLRKQRADWFCEDLTELFNLLAQGKIKPVIAERMGLDEAARGKIVLMVGK